MIRKFKVLIANIIQNKYIFNVKITIKTEIWIINLRTSLERINNII